MRILDGKKIAEKILENLKKEIKKKQLKLKLAVVLVGQDPMSKIFIKQKEKACRKIGIDFRLFNFSSKISELKLKKAIKKIAKNSEVSGMIIQLPLPRKFKPQEFLNLIPKEKNAEKISPVVCAVKRILKEYKISLRRKNIVLVGRGRLVGRPLAKWLKKQGVKFKGLSRLGRMSLINADIIISGVGKKNLITGDMVKRGVIVIDFGKDVDFNSVCKKASFITPTPGGVGPVVVACLLQNLVKLTEV